MNKKTTLLAIPTILIVIIGVVGATVLSPKLMTILEETLVPIQTKKPEYRLDAPSEVLPLADVSPQQRRAKLETIANQEESSLDQARAKYLLGSDLLREEFDGAKALDYLKHLDKQYPILAPYVLLREGRAYELNNNIEKAKEVWQQLISEHPDSLVTVDAYYKLGTYDDKYWAEAIDRFPQHPRSQSMARALLEKDPNQKSLLLLLAKYDLSAETKPILDRLISDYKDQLQPEEWDSIANNYWQNGYYAQAATAYERGTSNPENLYRLARSFQVAKAPTKAKAGFLNLEKTYPEATQTGLALRRLANLSTGDEALVYLNKVDDKYPTDAPEAQREKIKLLTNLGRYNEANEAQNLLLQKYTDSDEAADYRWDVASKHANVGNYVAAWQWAGEITTNNPDSSVAPKAGFWVGKWAEKMGQPEEAKNFYQFVLNNHPHSYYAWRSAVRLGKDVGDFGSLRNLDLKVETPINRPIPPAGSNTFKELFLLGEDTDAIDLFAAEVSNKENPSVSEQFTQGLLKQTQGKYLQSINLIWSLSKRNSPEDLREWQILRESPEYWYALFPFPYKDEVVEWSEKRNLNPFLVISLMRQESRFQKEIKSPVGATGLMQVMPDTGKWIAPQIDLEEYSLTNPDDSINLGTWYLDYTHETYNGNSMLAIASYNAGPGNVSNWLDRYSLNDVDEFVANIPFNETKNYVETVFANYWNYVLLYSPEIKDETTQE